MDEPIPNPTDTPASIALTEAEIQSRADWWQRTYGFFARNQHHKACAYCHEIGFDWMMPNSREINDELERRGVPRIESKEEYEALVAKHGLPPGLSDDRVTSDGNEEEPYGDRKEVEAVGEAFHADLMKLLDSYRLSNIGVIGLMPNAEKEHGMQVHSLFVMGRGKLKESLIQYAEGLMSQNGTILLESKTYKPKPTPDTERVH